MINRDHADDVASLVARRGGVVPADARGAVLVAADIRSGQLTVQLWEGTCVAISDSYKQEGGAHDDNAVLEWIRQLVRE